MELQDCAGYGDDSDVWDGVASGIGPVNSLLPRFDQVDEDEE